jgi:hypothetical protein
MERLSESIERHPPKQIFCQPHADRKRDSHLWQSFNRQI